MRHAASRIASGLVLAVVSLSSTAHADGVPAGATTSITPVDPRPIPSTGDTEPPASTQPVEVLPGTHPSRLAAYLFAGAAIVGAGVGTAFGIAALDEKTQYERTPTGASLASGNQDAVISDVALGAAVICAVTSVVLFLKHDDATAPDTPPPARAVSFTFAPLATPHGAGVGAVLRF